MTNSTYKRFKEMVSMWKTSTASSPFAWARRKVLHEVSASRGAGPTLRLRRIRRTVASLTW
ncbi:hypothetical protein AB0L65_31940 [Nonomuraea sp. NPDC052116]|uniref:hypothetical protein n=1 Tax=Nonomuraea sp. NPDC052116 TaxID=3155665 RepID=UPI00343CD1B7